VHPVHDVVTDVHGVRVFGQHAHLVGVVEAGALEGLFPPGGALHEGGADRLRRGVVDVIHDGLHDVGHRGRGVLLLEAVPRDEALLERAGERARVVVDLDAEEPRARIQAARRVARRRELHERVVLADADRGRCRRNRSDQRPRAVPGRERDGGLDLRVAREGLGARQVERAAGGVHGVVALLAVPQARGHAVRVAQEEFGGVDEEPPARFRFDLEGPEDGRGERLRHRLALGGAAVDGAEARVGLDEQDPGPHALEPHEARVPELVAVQPDGIGPDAGGERDLVDQVLARVWDLEEELALLVVPMQGEEAVLVLQLRRARGDGVGGGRCRGRRRRW
jgi:hypothetical protein